MEDKERFLGYYREIYKERWPLLQATLESGKKHYETLSYGPKEYHLDQASFLAAQALAPKEGEGVLDLCAAPGGKSLALAGMMNFRGSLTSNDRSATRRGRLKRVLKESLPEIHKLEITVTGHDAAKWLLHETSCYDKVLLDAPCSSEEHLLQNPKYLKDWKPGRTKKLAQTQYAMLLSALEVVKPEGLILYSTCSISPLENDGVVSRAMKKRPGRMALQDVTLPWGEKTDFGWEIFPDKSEGRGPIYLSLIKRLV